MSTPKGRRGSRSDSALVSDRRFGGAGSPDLLKQPIVVYRRASFFGSYYIFRIPSFFVEYLGSPKLWRIELGKDRIVLRPAGEYELKELRGTYVVYIRPTR